MADEEASDTDEAPVANASPDEDYQVGHCRPPLETRFPKGRSGNARGRPKGAKNTKTLLDQKLAEKVKVRMADGRERRLSKRDIGVTKLVNRFAEHGDLKIFEAILKLEGYGLGGGAAAPTPARDGEDVTAAGRSVLDWYVAKRSSGSESE